MQLHEALESVSNPFSFLAFAQLLVADRIDEVRKDAEKSSSPYGSGHNGWENGTIEAYLGAAISWAEDTNMGASQGLVPGNPWKQFAAFLYLGKIYE